MFDGTSRQPSSGILHLPSLTHLPVSELFRDFSVVLSLKRRKESYFPTILIS